MDLPRSDSKAGPFQRLLRGARAYEAPEPVAATFRARQLQAVLRLTPLTMLANAVNVVLILWAFWPEGPRIFLACWALLVGFVIHHGLRAWIGWRRSDKPWHTASLKAIRRGTMNAAALAALWAAVPLVLLAEAEPAHQIVVVAISTGMICAGGFALATTPVAGTVWVVILGGASTIALFTAGFPLAAPLAALLAVYNAIVVASVWSTARMFGARMMAEAEAERQSAIVGLLLRDFEENASDMLWEVDALGRLCHVSPRLERLFGMTAPALQEEHVLHWVQRALADDEAAPAQLAGLRQQLEAGLPFRDMPLTTGKPGRFRSWNISAKPLFDPQGRPAGWRGVASDVTAAQRANRQLRWLAHFDALTGAANRHQFRSRLAELLEGGPNAVRPFAVLCLDLDHFKTINDTMGHGVGDGLLQAVAQRLKTHTRRCDTVARLGGDEFAVLLENTPTVSEVDQLTTRLLEGLSLPCDVQGARIAVRASIGVAMAPADGEDIDTLLSNADLALYAAKSAGRGQHRFFEPGMAAQTRRRLLIEQALREALQRGELSLAYQPQVDLQTWRVTGFEALLRWHHPTLGAVPPTEFIPVAEESGLIIGIGAWVMQEACRQAVGWPGALTVSVNVSPVQAVSPNLRSVAVAALQASGLAPGRLELEITESIFLRDAESTLTLLHGLRGAGIRVALDDFGTGYSSLAYLRRFPFDTLKIDRSFVRELMNRRDARAIVRLILGLARALDMKTVAEGVEDPAQAGLLRHHGCGALQGFLVAPPMPAAAVVGWLDDWTAQPLLPCPPTLPTAPMPLETTM